MKKILKNAPLYLLTLANMIYALRNGFNWVFYVAMGLSAVCLALDLWEVRCDRKAD